MDLTTLIAPGLLAAVLGVIGWMVRNHLGKITALEVDVESLSKSLNDHLAKNETDKIKNIEADVRVLEARLSEHFVSATRDAATVRATLESIKEQITYQLHHIDEKVDRIIEREIKGGE